MTEDEKTMAARPAQGGGGGLPDAAVLMELQQRHAEPHRAHHNWALVAERLRLAEELSGGIGNRNAFVLAILFRDAVLDPQRNDNRAYSAALLRQRMAGLAPGEMLLRAEALIQAAGLHEIPKANDPSFRADAALFIDIGHVELGAAPERYAAYEAALRQEHAHLPDDAWQAARAAALQVLLWRDRIYLNDRFYLNMEKRARSNIAGMLARLRG